MNYYTLDEYDNNINKQVLGFLDFVNFVFKTSMNAMFILFIKFIWYSFKVIFIQCFIERLFNVY
jgi:hypothetical protein